LVGVAAAIVVRQEFNVAVKKIFWEDPYLAEIEATVTSVRDDIMTLDRTIIFAFSGGQQSDSGMIGRCEILEAKREGTEIFYTIPKDHALKTGDTVTVTIDWEKRYRLIKLHFAAELILELVYQHYDRPEKIGANITADKARVDFFWKGNISEMFPLLAAKAKELIDADLDIISAFADEETEQRYWEIAGFARVPCGGTHPKKTGEIGPITLKRNNIGGGKERIEIYLKS
jgi:Ser-tRNA(Ala) deacylase AlaX